MSCCWDIRCMDCGEEAGIDNANHQNILMAELVRLADLFANFGKTEVIYDIDLTVNYVHVPFEFFARHKGHNLRPISEYGQLDVVCTDEFRCTSCGAPKICEELRHVDRSLHVHGHKHSAFRWHYDK